MTRLYKLRSTRRGEHVHTTVFAGWEGQTLRNLGTLVSDIGEWQEFGALLLLGSQQPGWLGRIKIVCEGDEAVVSTTTVGEPRQ